jgi:hypothetical protein
MAPFRLTFQKSNACYIRRLHVDVMTNGTRGLQPSSVTLNEHQRNAPSHSIMVSYDSLTMSLYLPSGHNALDS